MCCRLTVLHFRMLKGAVRAVAHSHRHFGLCCRVRHPTPSHCLPATRCVCAADDGDCRLRGQPYLHACAHCRQHQESVYGINSLDVRLQVLSCILHCRRASRSQRQAPTRRRWSRPMMADGVPRCSSTVAQGVPLRLDSSGSAREYHIGGGAGTRTASSCSQTAHPQDLQFLAGLFRLGRPLLPVYVKCFHPHHDWYLT